MVQPHKQPSRLIVIALADLCRLSNCAINQPLRVNRDFIPKYTILITIRNCNSGPPWLMGFTSTQVVGQFQQDKQVCLKGLSLLKAKVVRVGLSYKLENVFVKHNAPNHMPDPKGNKII